MRHDSNTNLRNLLFISLSLLLWSEQVTCLLRIERASSWAKSLVDKSVVSYWKRDVTLEKKSLGKRGVNKTVYITDKSYQGDTFFDEWDFYSGPDYTHGLVNYTTREQAFGAGLAYIQNGTANMRVDSWTTLTLDEVNSGTKLRPSVRISTTQKFNQGLFILDVAKAPYGCATWPAYWTTNENWPTDGEVDIIENVHSSKSNQVSWHTTAGCTLTNPGNYTGTAGSTICDHNYESNTGCGVVDPSIASFGPTFNQKGGGVYAMKWDDEAISVWFFYRSAIPDDIIQGLPDPETWPLPSASLSSLGCPITQYFRNHELIFDTTLCGDWAGSDYAAAGCPGTCAGQVADPNSFVNATWAINYIKIYNKTVINTSYLDAGAEIVQPMSMGTAWICTLSLVAAGLLGLWW